MFACFSASVELVFVVLSVKQGGGKVFMHISIAMGRSRNRHLAKCSDRPVSLWVCV